jgi:hypothetical protein
VKFKTVVIAAVVVWIVITVASHHRDTTTLQHNLNQNPATTGLHVIGGGK